MNSLGSSVSAKHIYSQARSCAVRDESDERDEIHCQKSMHAAS